MFVIGQDLSSLFQTAAPKYHFAFETGKAFCALPVGRDECRPASPGSLSPPACFGKHSSTRLLLQNWALIAGSQNTQHLLPASSGLLLPEPSCLPPSFSPLPDWHVWLKGSFDRRQHTCICVCTVAAHSYVCLHTLLGGFRVSVLDRRNVKLAGLAA